MKVIHYGFDQKQMHLIRIAVEDYVKEWEPYCTHGLGVDVDHFLACLRSHDEIKDRDAA